MSPSITTPISLCPYLSLARSLSLTHVIFVSLLLSLHLSFSLSLSLPIRTDSGLGYHVADQNANRTGHLFLFNFCNPSFNCPCDEPNAHGGIGRWLSLSLSLSTSLSLSVSLSVSVSVSLSASLCLSPSLSVSL